VDQPASLRGRIPRWPARRGVAPLMRDTVHVWGYPLHGPAACNTDLLPVLSEAERVRVARYRFDRDRARFIVSRFHVRTLLARYAGVPFTALVFGAGARGKPFLADRPAIRSNWATSGELGLCAVALDREIGVDVEAIASMRAPMSLARSFCAPAELQALHCARPEEWPHLMARIWTMKEAYVKATGDGLDANLARVDVMQGCADPTTRTRQVNLDRGVWQVFELTPAIGYAAAVAIEGSRPVTIHTWSWAMAPDFISDPKP
jgi:4'-phosphopantetheinyl transferase